MSEKETMEYNQQRDLKQKEIDKEFVALRNKFFITIWLLLNDCIATHKGDGFVFYKGVDIAEAINNSLTDNTTLKP